MASGHLLLVARVHSAGRRLSAKYDVGRNFIRPQLYQCSKQSSLVDGQMHALCWYSAAFSVDQWHFADPPWAAHILGCGVFCSVCNRKTAMLSSSRFHLSCLLANFEPACAPLLFWWLMHVF